MIQVLPFLNNLKDLDPSYKTDLDLWDRFWKEKNSSYIRGNTVHRNTIKLNNHIEFVDQMGN